MAAHRRSLAIRSPRLPSALSEPYGSFDAVRHSRYRGHAAGRNFPSAKLTADVSLFSHHHSAPTLGQRAVDAGIAILHFPLAFWLTVIPIAGGLAIAYLTHRLNMSREGLALQREDERRRADAERTATRVRADLTFRLSRHRQALRAAARGDWSRFESEHETLVRRCAETDVIDLLGKRYPAFMALLQREETFLGTLRAGAPYDGPTIESLRTLEELESAFDAYVEQLTFTDGALVLKSPT